MTVSRFHVPAMDCAAEEQLIRMALDGRDDIARIEFDSQQRDVLIEHRSTADAIREVLEPLGLGARHVDDTSHMNTETDPTRERRALLIALVINAGFFVGELTGSIFRHFVAVQHDPFLRHDFYDYSQRRVQSLHECIGLRLFFGSHLSLFARAGVGAVCQRRVKPLLGLFVIMNNGPTFERDGAVFML